MKSPEWRRQRRRAIYNSFRYSGMDLLQFILDYQLGEPNIQCACFPRTMSAWSAFLMPSLPFVYGYSSSPPRAHCTPAKACLPCTTPAGMDLYTGPCPYALTECSPLDFRRSSVVRELQLIIIWPAVKLLALPSKEGHWPGSCNLGIIGSIPLTLSEGSWWIPPLWSFKSHSLTFETIAM